MAGSKRDATHHRRAIELARGNELAEHWGVTAARRIGLLVIAGWLAACGSRSPLADPLESADAAGGNAGAGGTLPTGGSGGVGGAPFGGSGGAPFGGSGGTPTGGNGGTATGGSGGFGGMVCTLEICDGIDNDCDGLVDDGIECPCTIASFEGQAYYFCSFGLSWDAASQYCKQIASHLVTINGDSENDFVSATAAAISTDKWWMGMNDLAQEGVWVWEDGSPVGYTDWQANEPNDAGGVEDCGQLLRFYPSFTWNDEPCGQALAFVCE